MRAIGIDIGGTKIAGAVVDELGQIVAHDRRPTSASEPQVIEDTVVSMVQHLTAEQAALGETVTAVGVAAAGFIDASQSIVYYAPNISWRNEPFREKLQHRLGLHIVIENDANAAGW
jgi:glucokinase